MNFPMGSPIIQFLYWLLNTAGVGAAIVILLILSVMVIFFFSLRWIAIAKKAEP